MWQEVEGSVHKYPNQLLQSQPFSEDLFSLARAWSPGAVHRAQSMGKGAASGCRVFPRAPLFCLFLFYLSISLYLAFMTVPTK